MLQDRTGQDRTGQDRTGQDRTGQDRTRVVWLDYARMFAIICVVITHVTETVYGLNMETLMSYDICKRVMVLSIFTIGRLGVPIFFFLTGYLLLDGEYSRDKYTSFLRRNFLGIVLTTTIWIVIYNAFNAWFYGAPFSVMKCLKNILFLQTTEMSHMWYMPVIIGMYLFLPFIANALKHTDIKSLYIPLMVAFAYQFLLPIINVYLAAYGKLGLSALLDTSFSGGGYGFLILIGYLVKKKAFDKISSATLATIGILSYAFTVFTQTHANEHGYGYAVWYNNATLIFTDLSIFILLSRASLGQRKLVTSISTMSFGVFLIHMLAIMLLNRYLSYDTNGVVRWIVIFVGAFIISWTISIILSKVKPIARIFLFQKG